MSVDLAGAGASTRVAGRGVPELLLVLLQAVLARRI